MRFMLLVKADEKSEAGVMPSKEEIETVGAYNEQLVQAGVLLAGDGLQPSAKGARLPVAKGGGRTVIDGPFTETKELIAGYWLLQVSSRDEAVEWARRAPELCGDLELRQVFEVTDFPAENVTPEEAARENALREEIARQARG